MTRRLIARTGRSSAGIHCTISLDSEMKVCEIVVSRGVEKISEKIVVPAALMHELLDGLHLAHDELRPRPTRAPRPA